MPRYDYQCNSCKIVIELEKSFGDDTEPLCCNESMTKCYSPTPAIFKGRGWGAKP
jgi:putative FmdB family regulatory protein